ncbi:MAG: aminodeoxychorismate/anthranilate synthase component II [Candidatus Diapherotrites archaeon]
MKILFIDNFDSFTFNLVDEFKKRNCIIEVYRNNTPMKKINEIVSEFRPDLIVLSPGPSNPENAGNCIKIINEFKGIIPIFGVCLGLQCIVTALGGKVSKCSETIHGKPSKVIHDKKTIFFELKNPIICGRYHSLSASEIPKELEISAKTENEIIMGVRAKKSIFLEGVQFHPESIMTSQGGKIIENIIELIGKKNEKLKNGEKND